MAGSPHPLLAREGWIFVGGTLLGLIVAVRSANAALFTVLLLFLALLIGLFRDPHRSVPSKPLAVLAPVDGRIVSVEPTDRGMLEREAMRIVIRVNNLGAYTARCPAEGRALNLLDNLTAGSRLLGIGGLWLRTDENDDIVLLMHGPRLLGRPSAFIRYGERVGQGQRCAYLRLARIAEVFFADDGPGRSRCRRSGTCRRGCSCDADSQVVAMHGIMQFKASLETK